MSKWKCDICGNGFDNFQAQGFNGKIYCPLCYFKEENKRLKQRIDKAIATIDEMMTGGYVDNLTFYSNDGREYVILKVIKKILQDKEID